MSTTAETLQAERAEVLSRLGRRQRTVVALDLISKALYLFSLASVSAVVILTGAPQTLWVLGLLVFAVPYVLSDELTHLFFGRALNRDHDLLLSLEAEELAARHR